MEAESHPEYVRCAHGGCSMVAPREVGACEMHIKATKIVDCIECGCKLPWAWSMARCETCQRDYLRAADAAAARGDVMTEKPAPDEQPVIRYGNVLMTLGQEINIAAQQLAALKRFEQRVIEAAKSPAAWLALREELGK